jgi:hypothetical protein
MKQELTSIQYDIKSSNGWLWRKAEDGTAFVPLVAKDLKVAEPWDSVSDGFLKLERRRDPVRMVFPIFITRAFYMASLDYAPPEVAGKGVYFTNEMYFGNFFPADNRGGYRKNIARADIVTFDTETEKRFVLDNKSKDLFYMIYRGCQNWIQGELPAIASIINDLKAEGDANKDVLMQLDPVSKRNLGMELRAIMSVRKDSDLGVRVSLNPAYMKDWK